MTTRAEQQMTPDEARLFLAAAAQERWVPDVEKLVEVMEGEEREEQ